MAKILLIEEDRKIQNDIRIWMKELEDISCDLFSSIEKFEEFYFYSKEKKESKTNKSDESETNKDDESEANKDESLEEKDPKSPESKRKKKRLFQPIDIIIINLELIKNNPIKWIREIRTKLKTLELFPENSRTKFVLLVYEDLKKDFEHFCHPFIDDIFVQPLDRTLIQQKIELLLGSTASSFIYTQETSEPILLAKISELIRFSEADFTIKNPIPFKKGTIAQIHSKYFKHEDKNHVLGRCYESTKPPNENGAYSHFSYFGILSSQLKSIRQLINNQNTQQKNEKFNSIPDPNQIKKLMNAEDQCFVIVDMNVDVTSSIKQILEENFVKTQCHTFASFNQFLGMTMQTDSSKVKPPPTESVKKPKKTNDDDEDEIIIDTFGFDDCIHLYIELLNETEKIGEIKPETRIKNPKFLGYSFNEIKDELFSIKNLINPEAQEEFREFWDYLLNGQDGKIVLPILSKNDTPFVAEIFGQPIKNSKDELTTLHLKFKKEEASKFKSKDPLSKVSLSKIDGFLIDASFIKPNIDDWLTLLSNHCKKHLNINDLSHLQIYILSDSRRRTDPNLFKHLQVTGFFYKPIDRRLILQSMPKINENLCQKNFENNLTYYEGRFVSKLSQTCTMVEISEFGAVIQYPQPIKENTFLYLIINILGDIGKNGLLAKSYLCKENNSDEGGYKIHFIFFGVRDSVLKRIRKWIKEKYVKEKDR